jgi:hypothetical protein
MNSTYFTVILVAFVILLCMKMYQDSEMFQLRCVISGVDGNEYCVRDRTKVNEAADLLAQTTNKCSKVVSLMKSKMPNHPITKRLVEGYNPDKVRETLPTSSHTAYSENKGEKMAFCLTKNKDGNPNKLIEPNTLMFVALHELSHIATVSIGHTPEYWDNFKFILERAVEYGLYTPVDYNKEPTGYCGMTITDNPLYDH